MMYHMYWVKRDKAGGSILPEAWEVSKEQTLTITAR